jgi:DNA polymerase-3 subunit gamma/tau
MSYQVLARKYRPNSFEEVIGQDHVIQALSNGITTKRIHQAYIFSGTRGVGKTTLARILARCLNCDSFSEPTSTPCNDCKICHEIRDGRHIDFLEVDAASRTGVDHMRELLDSVQYKPTSGRHKIYLIDEVHMLSTQSFNALLKTLEEPPSHVVFIFATTNPEKIPKTVQSRCLQLNLKTIRGPKLINHFKNILDLEKIKYDIEALNIIEEAANGSIRDGLTLLDQALAHGDGKLLYDNVKELLGTIDKSYLYSLLEAIFNNEANLAFDMLAKIEELSPEYEEILKSLISVLHEISINQVLGKSDNEKIIGLSNLIDEEFCQLQYEIAVNALSKFNIHPNPKECLEICILRMLTFNPLKSESSKSEKKNLTKSPKSLIGKKVEPVGQPIINEGLDKKRIESKNQEIVNKANNLSHLSIDKWNAMLLNFKLTPFLKNYYFNLEFIKHEEDKIYLKGDEAFIKIPNNIADEFIKILEKAINMKCKINLEQGTAENTPAMLEAKSYNDKKTIAIKKISQDGSVQQFLKKFNSTIDETSIKPKGLNNEE